MRTGTQTGFRRLAWTFVLMVCGSAYGSHVIEAEQFADQGGWVVDSQFIDQMGSSFLLAHGMGRPVADATTTFDCPAAGT